MIMASGIMENKFVEGKIPRDVAGMTKDLGAISGALDGDDGLALYNKYGLSCGSRLKTLQT